MEITLEQLMLGKATRIKEREYFTTEQYVTPFLDRMSKYTDKFAIQVKPADQISLNHDGEVNFENIVYNRVNIEAILPDEFAYEGHQQVVGFVYALDTRKPVCKQYMGAVRSACLNLTVFDSQALYVAGLEPETPINYSFLNACLSMTTTINNKLKQLESIEYTKEQCFAAMGQWVDRCINEKFVTDYGTVKLAESVPVEAYKNVFYNDKSDYYTDQGTVSGFDVYQSFTDLICHKKGADLVNRFEKCWLVSKVMGLN